MICEAEKIVRAQSCLNVLKSHVIVVVAVGVGVIDISQHLSGGRGDIDFLEGDSQAFAQCNRIGLGARRSRKAGQRVAQDICTRATQEVHRTSRNDQCVR